MRPSVPSVIASPYRSPSLPLELQAPAGERQRRLAVPAPEQQVGQRVADLRQPGVVLRLLIHLVGTESSRSA